LNPLKPEIDYSQFGGSKVEDSSVQEEKTIDYSQFGGEPAEKPKEKAGKFKSALLGVYEGILGIAGLGEYGINEYSKALEKSFGNEPTNLSFEEENPILSHLSSLPESEGEAARRLRVAGNVLPLAVLGGIPGIISGLVGSQAGQTIREVYGKEGKFDEFGWGEGAALGVDFLTGGATSIGLSAARKAGQTAASKVPSIFRNSETGLQRQVTKNAIQSESNALEKIINDFSANQLKGFEEEAAKLSPNRFTQLSQSNASEIKNEANRMFRNTQLSIISPIEATTEQAGRAIQDAANLTFRNEVQGAERTAYNSAREAAEGLSGQAPRTLEEAKNLRADLIKNNPTPEQRPLITFLDGLIENLESAEQTATRTANDLVDLIQRSNQAVNYGSELRLQSHRLSPVVSTLRSEVGEILSQNPLAYQLYRDANTLHARNAQIWGTRYMRNVRFSENPEQIISSSKKASNLRNLKQGINDPTIQGIAERAVIDKITESGSLVGNKNDIRNLSPELSPNARNSANALVDVKDPLTTTGGRAAIRNDILKDAAQAVNTGKRPEKILELMQTPKGYQIVKESLSGTPQSRELLKSFERLFLEDIVSSITDTSGVIDFRKAKNIFKNTEMKQVLEQMGGKNLIRKFEQLESFAKNFEKNISLYSKPETQSLVKNIASNVKNAGILTAVLHALHVPWDIIAGLGLATGTAKVAKLTYDSLQKKILSNPKAIHYLEQLSKATTTKEIGKQLPRLISELEVEEE